MKSKAKLPIPIPLFDTIETIKKIKLPKIIKQSFAKNNFEAAHVFLKEYDGL